VVEEEEEGAGIGKTLIVILPLVMIIIWHGVVNVAAVLLRDLGVRDY
jgi:hypothetical protein